MVSLVLDTPELAKVYDFRGQRQFEHGKLLIRDLGVSPGHSVLDVGAGTGLLTAYVAEIVGPKGHVLGIDPLPLRIELARSRSQGNLEFRVGAAENLEELEPESFDVVYLNSVFHWLPDKLRVLRQIHRVLKPNGRVGLSTASLEKPHSVEAARQRALANSGLAGYRELARGIAHRVDIGEVRTLFKESGYRALQLEIRTFVDYDASVDEVLEFSKSSSFGNDLSAFTDEQRQRFRAAFEKELETTRDAKGIRQERNLIFAVAEKASLPAAVSN